MLHKIEVVFVKSPFQWRGGTFLKANLSTIAIHKNIPVEAKASVTPELDKINRQFLALHHQTTQAELKLIETVIVYHLGELSLWKNTGTAFTLIDTQHVMVGGDTYNSIKVSTHIPFHIKTLLHPAEMKDMQLLNSKRNELKQLQSEIKSALTDIKGSSADIVNQEIILKKSSELISSLLAIPLNEKIDLQKLIDSYFASLQSEIYYNGNRATEIQLSRLNLTVDGWIKKHAIEMHKSRVIITGTHGPRSGLIEMKYFTRLYKEKMGLNDAVNETVYYSESLPQHLALIDIPKDLIQGFLGTAELNKTYGHSLNGDRKAMFRDLLEKHSPAILAGLFKKKPGCPMRWLQEKGVLGPAAMSYLKRLA